MCTKHCTKLTIITVINFIAPGHRQPLVSLLAAALPGGDK